MRRSSLLGLLGIPVLCGFASLTPYPRFTKTEVPVGSINIRIPNSVVCSVFYPSERSESHRPYITKEGLDRLQARFGIPSIFTKPIRAASHPTHFQAPPKDGEYPLIIFSHGLAGSKDLYSNICAQLAATGFVVCALEHEDGSATHARTTEGVDVEYDDCPIWSDLLSRQKQLSKRAPQLEKRSDTVKKVLGSLAGVLEETALAGSVNFEEKTFIGHSFGAASGVKYIIDNPSEFQNFVSWDCWALCLPDEYLDASLPFPIVNISSDHFAHDPRYVHCAKTTRRIFKRQGCDDIYFPDSSHLDFSDIGLYWLRPIGRFFECAGWTSIAAFQERVVGKTVAQISGRDSGEDFGFIPTSADDSFKSFDGIFCFCNDLRKYYGYIPKVYMPLFTKSS